MKSIPQHSSSIAVHWPLRCLPTVRLAGQFAVDDRNFSISYISPTHALQLHDWQGRMRIAGAIFEIQPGDVTLIPAGFVSSFDLAAPGQSLTVHFDPQRPGKQQTTPLPPFLRLGPWQQLATYKMMTIVDLLSGKNGFGIGLAAASAALQDFLLGLALQHRRIQESQDETRTSKAVEQAAAMLEQNLAHPCSIPEVARTVGLSQNYLAYHFRLRHGMTMRQYQLQRRVEQAQYLLTHTDIPIKNIGARVGMPDAQHFNKLFRRLMGQSPSAARASFRNVKSAG